MTRLPHIVWDMGGIMYVYFTELMIEVGVQRGWPLERIALGPTGMVHDADYDRLLDGSLDEPDYLPIIRRRLAAEGIDFDPPRDLRWQATERTEVWDAIAMLHGAGHRQAVLTNDASRWLGDNWWETWPYARFFDVMIDVKTLGVRKPRPEPYLAAARQLGVEPADCLFVDDLPANCRGAEAVGMQSHRFDITDPVGSVEALLQEVGIT